MNLREFGTELEVNARAGNAVLVKSGSGFGKSQKVRQVFRRMRAADAEKGIKWGFGTVFLATQTPSDLIGYQFKGETVVPAEYSSDGKEHKFTVTDPSMPLWMLSEDGIPACCFDKFFLVIDEYGQGDPDTKRASAEVLLNGGTPPWYLPPGSVRVACSNQGGSSDSRYGVTKDFDFCYARRTELAIHGDATIWIEDFADKAYTHQSQTWQVMPVVKAWARSNPGILFEKEPEKQGAWCNPRTLTSFDRYLQVKGGNDGSQIDPSDALTMEVGAGTIGQAATSSLLDHFRFAIELPQYDNVVADPEGTPVPARADLILLMVYKLAGSARPEDGAPLIKYIKRFPSDSAVSFIKSVMNRDYKAFTNSPPVMGWIAKNAALVNAMQAITG